MASDPTCEVSTHRYQQQFQTSQLPIYFKCLCFSSDPYSSFASPACPPASRLWLSQVNESMLTCVEVSMANLPLRSSQCQPQHSWPGRHVDSYFLAETEARSRSQTKLLYQLLSCNLVFMCSVGILSSSCTRMYIHIRFNKTIAHSFFFE